MSDFVNLTAHDVVVMRPNGKTMVIPPSGTVARVLTEEREAEPVDDIPCVNRDLCKVAGLPPAVEGTYYIVSSLTMLYAPERKDLLAPANLARDDAGNVVGCTAFVRR